MCKPYINQTSTHRTYRTHFSHANQFPYTVNTMAHLHSHVHIHDGIWVDANCCRLAYGPSNPNYFLPLSFSDRTVIFCEVSLKHQGNCVDLVLLSGMFVCICRILIVARIFLRGLVFIVLDSPRNSRWPRWFCGSFWGNKISQICIFSNELIFLSMKSRF